jgi:hypothetical protein
MDSFGGVVGEGLQFFANLSPTCILVYHVFWTSIGWLLCYARLGNLRLGVSFGYTDGMADCTSREIDVGIEVV